LRLPSLSIVVPAWNEKASIEATVADALTVGARVTDDLEVIVCNDASTDGTAAILDRLAAREPRLRVIHAPRNRGIEGSIRALYAAASKAWIFLNSADRQWRMDCLELMLAEALRGSDLVVGVRTDKRAVYTPYRRLLSRTYEAVVRGLGAPVGDPGSIKLGKSELLKAPVAARGVFAEGERLIRAARAGARVTGCEVPFERRRSGKATGARADVVKTAAVDVLRVAGSLVLGWPRPGP
jgi:glycosyltransferase involved in cell wall biosynthesis